MTTCNECTRMLKLEGCQLNVCGREKW